VRTQPPIRSSDHAELHTVSIVHLPVQVKGVYASLTVLAAGQWMWRWKRWTRFRLDSTGPRSLGHPMASLDGPRCNACGHGEAWPVGRRVHDSVQYGVADTCPWGETCQGRAPHVRSRRTHRPVKRSSLIPASLRAGAQRQSYILVGAGRPHDSTQVERLAAPRPVRQVSSPGRATPSPQWKPGLSRFST
jgi:hypothetical protein